MLLAADDAPIQALNLIFELGLTDVVFRTPCQLDTTSTTGTAPACYVRHAAQSMCSENARQGLNCPSDRRLLLLCACVAQWRRAEVPVKKRVLAAAPLVIKEGLKLKLKDADAAVGGSCIYSRLPRVLPAVVLL